MRRFWTNATCAPAGDGFRVLLDGRPVRLPAGPPLHLPGPDLAEAVAAEWQTAGAPGGEMSWNDVPLTRLAGTAQERIAPDPAPVAEALARYGESDLLCYRATGPDALVRRQAQGWQPLLDWAALTLDAPLRVTSGIGHVAQPAESLRALHRAVTAQGPYALAGLGLAVPALGSLVLGLALAGGRLDAAEAFRLSVLDETFQGELWGVDPEAAVRRERIAADLELAARFMVLAAAGEGGAA